MNGHFRGYPNNKVRPGYEPCDWGPPVNLPLLAQVAEILKSEEFCLEDFIEIKMGVEVQSVITMANSIIGVSVLAMPFCFKQVAQLCFLSSWNYHKFMSVEPL